MKTKGNTRIRTGAAEKIDKDWNGEGKRIISDIYLKAMLL